MHQEPQPSNLNSKYADAVLRGAKAPISVSIADTEAEREQGLSGTPSLPMHTGKFFIFESSGPEGFWMKDMRYPLDLVWIDSALHVVGVTARVDPSTYPTVFYAPSDVQYVLEVNAGDAEVLGITDGLKFTLEK